MRKVVRVFSSFLSLVKEATCVVSPESVMKAALEIGQCKWSAFAKKYCVDTGEFKSGRVVKSENCVLF